LTLLGAYPRALHTRHQQLFEAQADLPSSTSIERTHDTGRIVLHSLELCVECTQDGVHFLGREQLICAEQGYLPHLLLSLKHNTLMRCWRITQKGPNTGQRVMEGSASKQRGPPPGYVPCEAMCHKPPDACFNRVCTVDVYMYTQCIHRYTCVHSVFLSHYIVNVCIKDGNTYHNSGTSALCTQPQPRHILSSFQGTTAL
jgi:hypothetical protein